LEGSKVKLSTLQDGTRDGKLVVVSHDLTRAVAADRISKTLQGALDDWARVEPQLKRLYSSLETGSVCGEFPYDQSQAHSPLPRAYQWCEGSSYLVHLERCRRASKRDLPHALYEDIGMYQGGSDSFLPPHHSIPVRDDRWDVDLEVGICVITDDVPMGVEITEAASHIKLVLLTNDVSLRALQPAEAAKGFGAIQCKPANSFSPVTVTPEGLAAAWTGSLFARPVRSFVNGQPLGAPDGHVDANFNFCQLIAHLARTRNIVAGSIIGIGTVANRDESKGCSCILEKRAIEILASGKATTPYLKYGDHIRIESEDATGQSIFGAIDQTVVAS
jgi:fumarylacetoacetate (FAA) hydrolase